MTSYGFVHLEFGSAHRDRSLQLLGKLRRRLARDSNRFKLFIVDNARSGAAEPFSNTDFDAGLVVAGDNSNREFSGWDQGVRAALAAGDEPDVWVFSNDTVALNHAWSDDRAARFGAEIERLSYHGGRWLFGEINDFPRATMTPLGPLLEWVATYCFAMSSNLRSGLQTLSPDNAWLDSLVHDSFEPAHQLFRDNVGAGYVEFVSSWLIKDERDDSKQRRFKWSSEWHKARPLGPDNFDDLRMKARCCLSESMLTLRARQLGADIKSPYDARNLREHLKKSWQFLSDKLWERYLMRSQSKVAH